MVSDVPPSGAVTRQVGTVVVVDDHTTFAQMLARVLDVEPDFVSVGQCQTADQARRLVADQTP